MIIGVMSDSHDNMLNVEKAFKVFSESNVEVIVHLGDIISPFIVRKMIQLSWSGLKIYAVYGNNDGDKYLLQKLFNKNNWVISEAPTIIEISGKKLLLMHGYNGPDFTKNLAYSIVRHMNIDILLYGHTHEKDYKIIDGKIVLNPGEVYGYLSGEASVALIDLEKMKVEFIKL